MNESRIDLHMPYQLLQVVDTEARSANLPRNEYLRRLIQEHAGKPAQPAPQAQPVPTRADIERFTDALELLRSDAIGGLKETRKTLNGVTEAMINLTEAVVKSIKPAPAFDEYYSRAILSFPARSILSPKMALNRVMVVAYSYHCAFGRWPLIGDPDFPEMVDLPPNFPPEEWPQNPDEVIQLVKESS
ncbi:MAG: hypothetical protein AB1766_00400 [Pseudomonadota bacterium]